MTAHALRLHPLKALAFTIFALLAATAAHAAKPELYTYRGNLALNGYDTVAYFTEGAPVKGSKEFQAEYKGAIWRFSSAENLETFKADPDKYRPQYGGYCAYAVANGSTAKGDPEAWHIHEGKLYVNVSKRIRTRWLKKKEAYIVKADENYPKLVGKK